MKFSLIKKRKDFNKKMIQIYNNIINISLFNQMFLIQNRV